jgi:membrane-associated HD superfamily phosphohydrolase
VLLSHYLTRLLALVVSGFLAVVVTLAAGEPAVLLPALFPSLAAGLIIRRDAPRPEMIRAIVFLPLIWVVALLAMAYTSNLDLSGIQQQPWYLLLGLAPAPAAMILANYVLDAAFNTATISRLQEFDNQDHPLLRKLQLEAPGTWHHSMMVGLIAEAACQAVGGYSPWLSKIIVEGHVKDGIAMAQSHGLPKELIDTIPQHHGTSVITYFFRKALAMSENGYVNEYDYRYPGPKPQTLEAACINLADAAESSVRSLEDPTPHRIESLVGKIYEERLLDGQYDECGLALNQLEIIKKTIIDRLVGAYHARIEYPEEEELRRQLQLKRAEADKTAKKDRAAEKEE